jgi:hypothetical protein
MAALASKYQWPLTSCRILLSNCQGLSTAYCLPEERAPCNQQVTSHGARGYRRVGCRFAEEFTAGGEPFRETPRRPLTTSPGCAGILSRLAGCFMSTSQLGAPAHNPHGLACNCEAVDRTLFLLALIVPKSKAARLAFCVAWEKRAKAYCANLGNLSLCGTVLRGAHFSPANSRTPQAAGRSESGAPKGQVNPQREGKQPLKPASQSRSHDIAGFGRRSHM